MIKTNDTINLGLPVKTAFALGVFDGLHKGHRQVISKVLDQKQNGLMTGIFTFQEAREGDEFYKKDFKYIFSQHAKEKMFNQMGIDFVVSPDFANIKHYNCEDFVEGIIVKALNASVISCGSDFTFGMGAEGNAQTLKELCAKKGVEVIITPLVKDGEEAISSSKIRRLIENGEMEKAREMLCQSFFIDFPVIEGNKIGKKLLNIPTINQAFPKNHCIPKYGVYATRVELNGKAYAGATNVGVKPTVSKSGEILSETYINGFDGDLYGKNIKVEFLEFVRPEAKFASTDELKAQIEMDKLKCVEIFNSYEK